MRLRTRPPLLTYLLSFAGNHHGSGLLLAYLQVARRVLRLLQRYRFPSVIMVKLEDVGCLQGEGWNLGVLDEEVGPQYKVQGFGVHFVEPMGNAP